MKRGFKSQAIEFLAFVEVLIEGCVILSFQSPQCTPPLIAGMVDGFCSLVAQLKEPVFGDRFIDDKYNHAAAAAESIFVEKDLVFEQSSMLESSNLVFANASAASPVATSNAAPSNPTAVASKTPGMTVANEGIPSKAQAVVNSLRRSVVGL